MRRSLSPSAVDSSPNAFPPAPAIAMPMSSAGASSALWQRLSRFPRARLLGRALAYFRPDAGRVALLLGAIALSSLIGLLQVWPMAILIDSVIAPNPVRSTWLSAAPGWLAESRTLQVVALAVLTLLLRLSLELLGMARSLLSLRIGNNGLLRVRCDLFRKLQVLNLHYHRSQPQGDAIYRLTNDASGCQAVLNVLIDVGVAGCTLVIMLGIMLTRNVELTLIALTIAPFLFVTNVWFGRILKAQTVFAKEVDSQFTSTIQRSMSAIGLMQAFGREAVDFGRFRQTVDHNLAAWTRLQWQMCFYRLCVGFIFGAGGALIFGYGGWLVYRDQFVSPTPGGMTAGDLMVFLTYLAMFYDPLCKLSGAGASLHAGAAGAERVFEILDRDQVVVESPDAVDLPRQPRTLTLEDVGYHYPNGSEVLRGIDVTIRPGEMVAFVGSSGVGKSTLLNLLPRFFDPTRGSLALDDHDLRDVKLPDLRRHIALVLQESIVLPTSIAENIAYGRLDASEEQIRAAAEMAGAAAFIESLPDGYATVVSEGGQNLSGGQRQRLAIARALLTEAPIIVLDEPTSALDPHHEALVTDTLASLKGRRTIVLVSHRLSTVVDCDQIFVMHDGRIVEHGTHGQLVKQHGHYYEMARHQLQIEEPAYAAA